MVRYFFFVVSGICTLKISYDFCSNAFRANQAPFIILLLPACAVFVATGFSVVYQCIVHFQSKEMNIPLRITQVIAMLVLPCIVLGAIVNKTRQRSLRLTENAFLPVITDIEKTMTISGNPPEDITASMNKMDISSIPGYFPHRIVYYRNSNSYSLSIASGSADMDGSTNYWDVRSRRWVNVHNDTLQADEMSEEAKIFMQFDKKLPKVIYVYGDEQWKIPTES